MKSQNSEIAQQAPIVLNLNNSPTRQATSNLKINLSTNQIKSSTNFEQQLSFRREQSKKRQSLKQSASPYITHDQTKQYQKDLLLDSLKPSLHSLAADEIASTEGKYIYQNGKEYIQHSKKESLTEVQNRFRKLNDRLYLIDVRVNNVFSSHKIMIQILLPCAKQFELYCVDRNCRPVKKFKFSVCNKYRSTILKVYIPLKNGEYKIWKELQLPIVNHQDKIIFEFRQNCSLVQEKKNELNEQPTQNTVSFSGCSVSINHLQFKLPLNNHKTQQFYYMINMPTVATLLKIQLEKQADKHQRDTQDCQCKATQSCEIY